MIVWMTRHWAGLLSTAALLLIFAGYTLLECFSLHPTYGDESIYFYMAKATAERGLIPYRDYFFAHPPLQLVPLVLIWKLSGGHWLALKPVPWVASLVSALMVYLMAARCWGRLEGVLAAGLFLSSCLVLIVSSGGTGVNETLALALAGVYLLLWRGEFAAGIALGLAAQTGLYALPAMLAALAFVSLSNLSWRGGRLPALRSVLWNAFRRLRFLVGGFALAWGSVTAIMLALTGLEFPRQVWLYPLRMPSGGIGLGLGGGLASVALLHWYLVWAALLALPIFVLEWRQAARSAIPAAPRANKRRGRSQPSPVERPPEPAPGVWPSLWSNPRYRLFTFAVVLLLAVLCSLAGLRNVTIYYLVTLFPSLCLLAGFALGAWSRAAVGWASAALRGQAAWHRRSMVTVGLGLVFLMTCFPARAWFAQALGATPGAQGVPKTFTWFAAPLPASLNRAVKGLFWEGTGYPLLGGNPVREYLWYQSLYRYRFADSLAAHIRHHSRRNETILGDMELAPMLALLSDRRLAADIADTSRMRFATGSLTLNGFWEQVTSDHPASLILDVPGDLCAVPGIRALIARDCKLLRTYDCGYPMGDVHLYEFTAHRLGR